MANIAYQLADVSNFTDAEEKNEVRDDCLNKIKTSKKYQEVEWGLNVFEQSLHGRVNHNRRKIMAKAYRDQMSQVSVSSFGTPCTVKKRPQRSCFETRVSFAKDTKQSEDNVNQ